MLIPSAITVQNGTGSSLSRRVNANSQLDMEMYGRDLKLIKKGEC